MEYKHLTPIERESIMKLSVQGYGVRAIVLESVEKGHYGFIEKGQKLVHRKGQF